MAHFDYIPKDSIDSAALRSVLLQRDLQKGCNIFLYYMHSDYAHRSKRVQKINMNCIWLEESEQLKTEKAGEEENKCDRQKGKHFCMVWKLF